MTQYNDRSILYRAKFKIAMYNEDTLIAWGVKSGSMKRRLKKRLIDNLHKQALEEDERISALLALADKVLNAMEDVDAIMKIVDEAFDIHAEEEE